MDFKTAFELLKKGEKIKRQNWSGYWQMQDDKVMMYCKDGRVLDFRETEDTIYTLSNTTANDWELADEANSKLLEGVIIETFTFGEAIRLLKQGKRVCRQGWNGKGMWLVLVPADRWNTSVGPHYVENAHLLPWIGMKTADGGLVPWLVSQTDMLSVDWQVAE
jgi:hypothetical protein